MFGTKGKAKGTDLGMVQNAASRVAGNAREPLARFGTMTETDAAAPLTESVADARVGGTAALKGFTPETFREAATRKVLGPKSITPEMTAQLRALLQGYTGYEPDDTEVTDYVAQVMGQGLI